MTAILWGIGVGAVVVALVAILQPIPRLFRDLLGLLERVASALEASSLDTGVELERRLTAMEESLDRLPQKWEDIKRDAKSQYERARHHVRRVQEELEARGLEDPEIAGLDRQLRLVDGAGGEAEGVPPVHQDMGGAPAQAPPEPEDGVDYARGRKFSGNP